MNSRWDATIEKEKQVKVVPHFHVIDSVSCIQAKSHPYVAKSRPHN